MSHPSFVRQDHQFTAKFLGSFVNTLSRPFGLGIKIQSMRRSCIVDGLLSNLGTQQQHGQTVHAPRQYDAHCTELRLTESGGNHQDGNDPQKTWVEHSITAKIY